VSAVVLERGKAILGDREVLSNLMVIPGFNEQNLFIEGPDSARIRYEPASPKAFREEDVVEDRSFLRARYADEGYLYAQIDAIREFSDDLTEVVITYRITEGEKVRIADDIGIKGNNRTKHRVIERELSDRLTEEKYFSYTEIAESWQRLLDLGIFESVRIDTEPITETGDIVKMTVEVKERNAISANLHAGFGSSEDLRAGIEATHINLWGTNRKLGGKVQIGTKGTRGEINYSEPRLLGTGAVGLIDIYRYSEKDYKDYPVTRTGGTVGIRQRLHRANTLTYRYRYDHVKYEDEDMIERVTDIGRIETTFQRDTRRDSRLNPKRGWLNVLALEYADDRLGGSETFAKFMLNSARYTSLSQNVVLALGARTGYAWELGSTKRILTPERFDLSDYTTPRGYDWTAKDDGAEDAGSAMIGNFILNTSVELRFPIYKWIGGGIFFDSGYVCDEISDFDVRSMKSSVGLGLRFSTPIGPVRLDYGYPVRGDGNRYYWPHLAIGHAF
jgi:outer membrane protein insertion porin family